MNETLVLILLVLIVGCGLGSAMFRSMLHSAVSLALLSATLAIVMMMMGATWAGLFELSVCAGLVTVIFVSAISLTQPIRRHPEHSEDHHRRFMALPFILIVVGVAMIATVLLGHFAVNPVLQPETAETAATFKEVFWGSRQADILGQIIVILAGAFAVVILFKEGSEA
ncbi:MAG: NADH-quinone oxidoreductase subunit J [Bacillota bacterium]|nr:NADH-quinone oxidoreductase subunit J [Bacillota bacterium]